MKTRKPIAFAILFLWTLLEQAHAVEIEPMGKAVATLLGTTKAFKKTIGSQTLFYSKGKNGKTNEVAFIQHGLYPPNCTHTWAVGIDAASGRVTHVRVIEMACPHAFPTRSESFLEQYSGKGPADVAKLESQATTIAKATGTSKLATEAVKKSIQEYARIKGKI